MPRNDRSCCDCQGGIPNCCESCASSDCQRTVQKSIGFSITPAVYTCTNFLEVICDPNCDIETIDQSDPALIQRKNYGCQQEGFSRIEEAAYNLNCATSYLGGNGTCGSSAYLIDWYNAFISGNCDSMPPVGGGVVRKTYRTVSGNLLINFTRTQNCLQSVSIAAPSGSAQYSECIIGTDNYMGEHGRSCSFVDAPSQSCGLNNSPQCVGFTVSHNCNVCPFCPPFPIKQGQPYLQISGTLKVIRDYTWADEPLNGSGECNDGLPSSDTSTFLFEATMSGTMSGDFTTYRMASSSLRSTDHGNVPRLFDVGVDFDDFTI